MSTGSKVINPNNVYTLDFETSHLYFKELFSAKYVDGVFQQPDLAATAEAYKPVVPLQFGIQKGVGKTITHVDIDDAHSIFMPREYGEPLETTFVSRDGTRKMKGVMGKTKYHTREELFNALSAPGSKLDKRKVDWYMDKVAWHYLGKDNATTMTVTTKTGKKLNQSMFSGQKFSLDNTPESIRKAVIADGIQHQTVNFNKFIESGEADSLAGMVSEILQKGSLDSPSMLRAWNAPFDIGFIRAILANNGNVKLAKEFDNAVATGKLAIDSVERDWQLIAYNLVKDDPDAASKILIKFTPDAAIATGRVGKAAQTFEEFQHSTVAWGQEAVSKYFKWYSKVGELGKQSHFAGPDVKLTSALAEAFEAIKNEAMMGAANKQLTFGTFEGLARSEHGASVISEAVDNVMSRHMAGVLGTKGAHANILKKEVMEDAARSAKWYQQNFAGFYASKLAEKNSQKWTAKYGKRYAGMAAGIGAILAMTYMNTDSESDIEEFKHGIAGRPEGTGKESWGAHRYIDRQAHYKTHVAKAMAMGIAAPFGVLYAVGLNQSMRDPKWFKGKSPDNVFAYAKDIVKTAAYGARRIESSFPITRLFGVSSISDYLYGSRRLSDEDGMHGKSKSFRIVSDGKQQEFGLEFEEFLEAAQKSNPEKYDQLREILKPQKLSPALDKRIVRIQTLRGGGTKVYWDDSEKVVKDSVSVGNKVSGNLTVDLNTKYTNLRTVDPKFNESAVRQAYKLERERNAYAKKDIINPLVYERYKEYASQHGMDKGTFEEFIKRGRMPQGVSSNGVLNKIWTAGEYARYKLDIGSKGIGEGRDLFAPATTDILRRTKGVVSVQSFSKDAFSPESMKYFYNTYKHIARQTIVPIYGMNTFLERPFETMGLGEWAENTLGLQANKLQESASIAKNVAGKALSFIHRPGLGLRIDAMKYGLPQYAAEFGLKRILPAYLGVQAFSLLDKGLGALTMSPTGHGPLTGIPIKAWETLALGYSKASDMLGLTSVAKKQEAVAPGSTGIGFFAPALSAYSIYRGAKFLHESGPTPIRNGITSLLDYARKVPFVDQALKGERYLGAITKTPIQRYMSWAVKNPLMGFLSASLVPMAPFIPGLLGSNKSYQERKAEYDGKKDVAIRKYRGWLLSSSAYGGGKVNQFRKHALNLMENNWQDKGVIYPSVGAHLAHSLSFGLYDRYMLENYHAKDQPVYTSAPYGGNVPFLGNLFAATIGNIIKPEVQYHEMHEEQVAGTGTPVGVSGGIASDLAAGSIVESGAVDIENPNSIGARASAFQKSFSEWSGLKGFIGETTMQYLTGKQAPDEFVPYAQNATQMYNPANIMWGYQAGDVSIIGGEFLRRIFQRPQKSWEINDIPNELYGVSWIPQQYDTQNKHRKDFTHGTTFDKAPMGWLYASRKGWDYLYGDETKGKELEAYGAPVRTEILKTLGPSTNEFREAATDTLKMALNNNLDPAREQRFYNTLDQVRQLKEQVWAAGQEYSYKVETMDLNATVSSVDAESGTFMIDGHEDRIYRLAGVSTAIEDIRSRLLQKKTYESALKLDQDAKMIRNNIVETIKKNIVQGQQIDMAVAQADQLQSNKGGVEAIIGTLNKELIENGAPFADTGTLATHNIAQDRVGPAGTLAAKYWEMLTSADTLANKKLISKRDYFSQYLTSQYFNKEVKLWSHPFKHLVEPFVASVAHNVGIDMMPSFTAERRQKQQYWDVLKYVKYKMLAVQASRAGDEESAALYQTKYASTMVGTDPTDDTFKDELNALPLNERAYFDYFANEPNAKKRAKIYKYLPAASKRLYTGLWAKKMAAAGDKDMQQLFNQLKETGGYKLSAEEERMYQEETSGAGDKKAWARAHFVREYMEDHELPGADWAGWSPDVDLEDVEILALKDQGEQVQDYGFFDDKVRMAAFNGTAYAAAIDMQHNFGNEASVTGTIMPIIAQNDYVDSAYGMPTSSPYPMNAGAITTNTQQKVIMKHGDKYLPLIDDAFMMVRGFF